MIGFNHLGKHGRLGNQMFQYAALRGIAARHNYEFCIPESNFQNPWQDHQLFEAFELPNLKHKKFLPANYYQEPHFHYSQEYVDKCPDNVNIYGYFQTEKYFKNIKKSIKEDFTFKKEILEPCKEAFDFDQMISLHVRRTDYLEKSKDHPPCSMEYYQNALTQFNSDIPVMVFSDDVYWCRKQDLFSSDRFMISENTWNLIDMCLMTLCSHHIISNSSFSWWGAWLSGSKNVIAPAQWFGDSGYTASNNTKDIVPEEWTRL
jgi:hypothetical protein